MTGIAIASRAPDKRGRPWVLRSRVSTLEPMQDIPGERFYTYEEAAERRRELMR